MPKIYSFQGDVKVLAAAIAAEYAKVTLEIAPFDASKELQSPEFLAKSPLGKLPVLELCSGETFFEIDAILRFLGSLNRGAELLGLGAVAEAQVDQWVAFAHNQLAPVANQITYSVLEAIAFNKAAIDKAKNELKTLLKVLDNHLASRTYLVGEAVTIADIAVSTSLLLAFKLILGTAEQKTSQNVTRWFTTVVNQRHFQTILGTVELAKEAKEAKPPGGGAKADKPKAAAPAPAPAAAAPAAAAHGGDDDDEEGTKEEKPKGPHWTDLLPKSTMVMDNWKRTYSNEETRPVANPEFWKMLDHEGYSLWYCQYKYSDELDEVFKTCNLVGGWFQRLDRCRKFTFGNVHIFGEKGKMEIRGVWLFRGKQIPEEFKEVDDYVLYDFKEIPLPPSAADKELVEDYWAWDGKFGGVKLAFNQGKTFK